MLQIPMCMPNESHVATQAILHHALQRVKGTARADGRGNLVQTFLGCVKLSMSLTSSTRSPAMFRTDSHRLFSVNESSVGSQKLTSL